MAVGTQPSVGGINSTLTQLALAQRELANDQIELGAYLNGLGTAGLQALGFSVPDAATVLQLVNYMTTVAGCYKGTVQQGGTGGTGAILFSFESALTQLWGAS